MILTLDVGNTNIKIAVFDGAEMVHYWRLSTTRKYTSDEMGVMIHHMFQHKKIDLKKIGIIAGMALATYLGIISGEGETLLFIIPAGLYWIVKGV